MKNLYLYGASDDCHEINTDFDQGFESYGDIAINDVVAHYEYEDDWGIELRGEIPPTWKVKAITGNAPDGYRWKPNAGQFIHLQIPDDETVIYRDLSEDQ